MYLVIEQLLNGLQFGLLLFLLARADAGVRHHGFLNWRTVRST